MSRPVSFLCFRCGLRNETGSANVLTSCERCGGSLGRLDSTLIEAADEGLWNPGERIGGRYRILRRVGLGGASEVYQATDEELGRTVALKVLRDLSRQQLARLRQEAVVMAKLSHRNIVPLYEVAEHEGEPFLVMPYVEGCPIHEAGLSIPEIVEAARQVADALHHAHEHGIVHRDVKPSNIMVEHCKDGSEMPAVYVLDFGLAKQQAIDTNISRTGVVVGTPAYMSPEQARGEPADARSDVYGLGATVYELLTGQPPFAAGGSTEILNAVLCGDLVSPRKLRRGLDRPLEAIVLKSMERVAERRYASAAELRDDLRRYQQGEATLARPISRFRSMLRPFRRRPWLAALLVLAVVALGLLIGLRAENGRRRSLEQDQVRMQEAARRRERVQQLWEEANELMYQGLATAKDVQDRSGRCIHEADEAVQRFSSDPVLYLYRGKALRLLGEDTRAEQDFQEALRLDPDMGAAHFELAWLCLERVLFAPCSGSDGEMKRVWLFLVGVMPRGLC